MSRKKSNRGRFFGRRRAKVVDVRVAIDEPRALEPRHSLDDWLAFIEIVRAQREQLEESR
jgi:hypothetical protein